MNTAKSFGVGVIAYCTCQQFAMLHLFFELLKTFHELERIIAGILSPINKCLFNKYLLKRYCLLTNRILCEMLLEMV